MKSCSKNYLHKRLAVLGIIERFDVQGKYPDGRQRQRVVKRGIYHSLQPGFKALIDFYREAEESRGKKESSIYCESHGAASFLLALQQNGIDTLEKITEEAALSIFLAEDGTLRRSYAYKRNVAAFI